MKKIIYCFLFLFPAIVVYGKDAADITRSLTLTVPTRCTFCKDNSLDKSETDFLTNVATRGLSFEVIKKIDKIAEEKELPKIDIVIHFDYNSDVIKTSSIPKINELGKALLSKELSSFRILLNGHTDAAGDNSYNLTLSERRAASVRNYLIKTFGIDSSRLIAVGFGEEKLKLPESPLDAANRRVEIVNLAVKVSNR